MLVTAIGLEPVAAAAPADQASLLRVVFGLAAALVLAVAAAHPVVRRIERRLGLTVLLSSGLPFLAMGVIFHLDRVGILTDAVVNDLRPALEFGLGWLGFVVGMQFDVRDIDHMPEKTGSVVVAESVIPLVAAAAACFVAMIAIQFFGAFDKTETFGWQLGVAVSSDAFRDALALGACAAPAAPVAAVAIARSSGSVAASLVQRITMLNDGAGIVVLLLICAFFRPSDAVAAWKLSHIGWLFVTLGMGGVLGILTYVLVRSASSLPEEVAYLLGAIALSAGMSGYLGISPLVSCAIAGALLTNLPHKDARELKQTMIQLERPLYLIFLLIAGALWDPTQLAGWVLVPVFALTRVAGKIVGAHVAEHTGPKELPDATTLGLALAPQSPIAIATIVSYMTLYGVRPAATSLMTAVIGSAVITELAVQAIARGRGGLKFDIGNPSFSSIRPPPPSFMSAALHATDAALGAPTLPDIPTETKTKHPTDPGLGGGGHGP